MAKHEKNGKGGGHLHKHQPLKNLGGDLEGKRLGDTVTQYLKRTTGKSDKAIKQILKKRGVDTHGRRLKHNGNNKH